MADCFFLHYEMSNDDVTFYCSPFCHADIKGNDIIVFFSELGTLELHISRTACQILLIHVSLCVIF